MIEQLPLLVIIVPFLGALIGGVFSIRYPKILTPSAYLILGLNFVYALLLALAVVRDGPMSYHLGGWAPPQGIEFVADSYSALLLAIVSLAALLGFINAHDYLPSGRQGTYYFSLYFLFLSGSQGMLISGDIFNIYVFLEVAALSGYALLGFGSRKAIFACFRYLIIGSIGASFYLLGVGYLYLKTGSLNMGQIASLLPQIAESRSLVAAFGLIVVGLGVKMAIFPMHGWLSQVYTHTSPASRILIAPLATKISICVLIRLIFSVFGVQYVFDQLAWQPIMQVCACFAIVVGTVWAFSQTDLRRMITYLMIVEVGYIFGGVWLGNSMGVRGAVFHIFVDILMTLGLFVALAFHEEDGKAVTVQSLRNFCTASPVASAGMLLVMASMVGVPPFGGFVSKFYLLAGAAQAQQWPFLICVVASSLCIALMFVRMLEHMLGMSGSDTGPVAVFSSLREYSLLFIGVLLLLIGLTSSLLVTHIAYPLLH